MGVLENSDDDLVHKKSFIVEKFKELSENERIPYTQTLYGGRFTEYNINNTIVGLKAEKDGLLMYEGTYKSRTKESGFPWGVVAELIGQLIDSGKYLPKEKEEQEQEQSAQIGLFDYVADIPEEQYADESNQVSLFTEFGVSQQIIDEALCIGANDTNSTLDIAMFLRRDRGTEYNTEFLKKHYKTNGAGFYFNNEQVSVWYNENGFNVTKGTTAQKPSTTHLTWEQVAKRIRELLDMGRYIPQEKLDMIDDRELSIVSDRIISFVRDMNDEESSEYLPRGKKIVDNILGYPDEVAALKEYLSDGNNSVAVFREYSKFANAYENGMINLYKYNYEYSVPYVYEIFKGMQIEPIKFKTADDFNPNRQYFISNDEIDNFLRRGKSSAESRFRIYTGFVSRPERADRVKFIKDYYGLSGSYSGNDNIDSSPKGLTISHGNIMEPYAKVVLKWNQVEKHIDDMIKNNRFFYDSDFDELQNIYKRDISYSVESFFNDLPDEYAKPYPKETETYNISYVVRDKLDNPQELDNIEKMMSDAMALMSEDYNGYKYRKQEYDDFVAFKNGTYAPYKVPEKVEPKPPHTFTSKFSKPAENKNVLPEWLTEYREIKAENPQAIVFYQQGDFYEAFEQDAVKVANELDLVLTSRHINENTGKRIAMCGFPKHSLDKYMKYLADKGYKIAVSSLGNDERKTIWYAPDYSEDENEKEEQNISIEPTFQAPPKANAYTFDLHPEIPIADRHNYNFAEKEIETVGKKERFRGNMEAIRVLKECEFDNRFATPEEQEILSGYVGWGGISEAFDENNDAWADEFQELYTALSPTEYEAARRSTLTAFYTPQPVISAIYKALNKLGFKQGNILEPCCAIGNFIGMLPQNMQDSKIYGVEIDNISAGIAQQLYQKSSIMTAPFEKAELPESFFDAVVGNVPFGDFLLADKKYDKYHFLIHDYFFAKSLDKLRPGGVLCLVTSKGTMDKESSDVRRYIAQRAELLGAIRLPDNTFKCNAGTEVTSDIFILQKRDRVVDIEPDWLFLDEDANGIRMNKYFVEHPDMVLGEMVMQSGRFKPESACKAYEDRTLEEQLDIAVQNINGEITEYTIEDVEENEVNYIPADPNVRNYSYTVVDGTIYYRENSVMREVETSETGKNRIKGMIEIRDCVKNLLEMQSNDYPDYDIEKEQHRLNEIYDKFVKKYGYINSRGNSTAFSDDSSYFLICSLEVFKNDEFERKADIFTKRTIQPHIAKTHADTSIEAYGISIGEKAKIDMPFMCQLTGKSEEEIFADLNGVIFLNPDYDENNKGVPKYLPTDEYLSGNVRRKFRQVREIAENDDRFAANVDALEKVQPVDLKATEIEVHLGVTWLPIEIINKFMYETFNTSYYARGAIKVHYNELANVWNIEHKAADNTNLIVTQKYGTSRKNAFHILEATLNLRNVRVFDYEEDENGKRVAILNKKETAIAQSKQELIKQAFKDWIWKDPERREYLCKLYNKKFNSIRPREYDGSHIVFEGMNPEITLRKHQQDAVARGLYGGNTLLAHCVGAGKTYTMAATAMESKRLGLCSKSLFVVPNHLVSQWASEFLTLYPFAKILATTKKDFETKNRKKFCGRIATGDYDAIIIGHSQFEKIPVSVGRQMFTLQKQIDEIIEGISELKASNGERFSVKQLEATKTRLETKLKKLNDQSDKDDVVTFEELGVDRLFVDEAHYYKNLFVYSKMRNVGGISQVEANKSSDMFMKCQYLDELTDSKGITFATGTPISNSMVELYTMQRYLQYDLLREYGYVNFDSWAAQYGETVTTIELTPEGTGYRSKVRFARFNNLPELMSMFKECADIQTSDMLKLPVPNVEHHNISVKPSEFQVEMVEQLGERAEKIRAGDVKPYVDNMLNITNDGRKLALDQRLINPTLPDFEGSKVNECVRNVYDIWAENSDKKSTQLVFCDLSTPTTKSSVEVTDAEVTDNEDMPETFKNIYVDIRNKLIAKGIPAEEIAFIHEANNDKQKADLFAKVRAGKVRVLLGSTQKMGAGTNVQDKIIASHDIDCPWRPSDVGRILRTFKIKKNVEVTDNG
ncbi:DEAD/DEAH box helicase family protein, partial [uncultured Eubacterium sp.]|uniref:DEAD/DEAH box helicase family protein n=1 Tax=uncultured Eubacterium sp. TaxID=165185 RepID=UPI00344CE14B